MTESPARWVAREALALLGLYGFVLSLVLYAIGLLLGGAAVLAPAVGPSVPALLCQVGAWGMAFAMIGEVLLWVSGWLIDHLAPSQLPRREGQNPKDAA